MKTFHELNEEYARNGAEINKIEEFFKGEYRTRLIAITGGRLLRKGESTEEQKKALDELGREEKEKNDRLNVLKVAQRVLYENIRQAYFVETMPKVLEVFNKFKGKPIGEVTAAKINDALKPSGVRVWIHAEPDYRSDELHLSPISCPYFFRSDDLTVTVKRKDGEKQPILAGSTGNRLQVYDLDQYALAWCGDYVEDYMSRAAALEEEYKEIQAQYKEIEEKIKSINEKLPKSIGSVLPENLHYNSLAARVY
jgi:hypothetical protein